MGSVYQILDVGKNRSYVGSSCNYKRRWNEHKKELRKNIHPNKKLQNAWNSYGEDNFSFSILEQSIDLSNERLIECENKWMNKLNSLSRISGFNLQKADFIEREGWSQESKNKFSESRKGIGNPMFGKKMNLNTKLAIIASRKSNTPEHNKKVSEARLGMSLNGPVLQISGGKILNKFKSIPAAALALRKDPSAIYAVCKNKRETAYGFKWEYAERN